MKPLTTLILCVIVLGVAVAGRFALAAFKTEPAQSARVATPRIISSMVVEQGERRIDVTTQGQVAPRHQINLVAQVAGEVMKISPSLENGGFFAVNEVLIQIDDRDYKLEVTRADALVAQAELRLNQEAAEAAIAKREWESVGKGKASPLTLREPQVKQAKAELGSANAALAKAKLALERTQIRARFAGRVRTKSIDAGQFVAMGTVLAQIYSIDSAEVRLPIPDHALKYIDIPLSYQKPGSQPHQPKVTLTARFAQADQDWTGTIVRTEGEVDPKSRMIHAIARINDPYGRTDARSGAPLAVGMFVTATIHGRTYENVTEVPRTALRDDDTVLVVDSENRLRQQTVGVLYRNDKIAVVEKGLATGDRICLSPISVFVAGMSVELESAAPTEIDPGQEAEK